MDSPEVAAKLNKHSGGELGFDPNKWLTIHALVELRSTKKLPIYPDNAAVWDGQGFSLSRLNRRVSSYVEKCKDDKVASRLSATRDHTLGSVGLKDAGVFVQIFGMEDWRCMGASGTEKAERLDDVLSDMETSGIKRICQNLDSSGQKHLEPLLIEEGVKID